jgi:hypothetical protein
MRTATLIAAALASVAPALAAGCEGRVPPATQGRQVVRPALRFAMDLAPDWTVHDLSGDVVLEAIVQAPKTGEVPKADQPPATSADRRAERTRTVVHVLVVEREDASLDAWADRAVKESQELQSDLEVVEKAPAALADGRPALRLTLKNPRGVEPFLQKMLLVMTDSTAYAVIATATASDFQAAEHDIDTCFRTFIVW